MRLTWLALSSLNLSTWLESLPASLKLNSHSIKSALPHVLTMHLSWASFVIMLHKPFYRPVAQLPSGGPPSNVNAETAVKVSRRRLVPQARHVTHSPPLKQCDRAALQIITLIQTWNKLHDLHFAPPPVLECCFTAGTTHLLAYTCAKTEKKRFDALQRVRECIDLMKIMADTWPAARQKQDLLEGLAEQYSKDQEEQTEEQSKERHEVKLEQDMLFSEMPHLGLGDQPDYSAFKVLRDDQGTHPNQSQDGPWRMPSVPNHQARFHAEDPNFPSPTLLNGSYPRNSEAAAIQYAPPPLQDWIPDMGYGYQNLPTNPQQSDTMNFAPPFDFDLAAFDDSNPAEWNIDQLALLHSQAWLDQANRETDANRG